MYKYILRIYFYFSPKFQEIGKHWLFLTENMTINQDAIIQETTSVNGRQNVAVRNFFWLQINTIHFGTY